MDVAINTSRKTLFVSRASQMDRDVAKNVFNFFKTSLMFSPNLPIEAVEILFNTYKSELLTALQIADSDIVDIKLKKEKIRSKHVILPTTPTDTIPVKDVEQTLLMFTTFHKSDPSVPFDMEHEESAGTRADRFLQNAPASALEEVKAKLVESLPAPNASSFLLGSGFRFVSWIARESAFSGAATILDAGNLTAAAALMEAVRDLRSGDADVSLAGVVTSPLSRAYLEGLSGIVQFSSRTAYAPFSQDADGTIPGEGGAFFVLKRREDALRSHDRIYALIRSGAIGHNPDDDGSEIIARTLHRVGVEARTVGLIEADGSGIPGPEAREIAAVQKLWGEHHPGGPLVGIGSIKGNIGHTLKAAMAAGVVKAALALYHRVLPPQIAPERPLEALSNLASSAYLITEPRPWITGDATAPRRAIVSGDNFDPTDAIGRTSLGGRSAAILLEEEPG